MFIALDDDGNEINAANLEYALQKEAKKVFKCICEEEKCLKTNLIFVNEHTRITQDGEHIPIRKHFKHLPGKKCNYSVSFHKNIKYYIDEFHKKWINVFLDKFKYRYWNNINIADISSCLIYCLIRNTLLKKEYIINEQKHIKNKTLLWILSIGDVRQIKRITKKNNKYYIDFINKLDFNYFDENKSIIFLDDNENKSKCVFKLNLTPNELYGYEIEPLDYKIFISQYFNDLVKEEYIERSDDYIDFEDWLKIYNFKDIDEHNRILEKKENDKIEKQKAEELRKIEFEKERKEQIEKRWTEFEKQRAQGEELRKQQIEKQFAKEKQLIEICKEYGLIIHGGIDYLKERIKNFEYYKNKCKDLDIIGENITDLIKSIEGDIYDKRSDKDFGIYTGTCLSRLEYQLRKYIVLQDICKNIGISCNKTTISYMREKINGNKIIKSKVYKYLKEKCTTMNLSTSGHIKTLQHLIIKNITL